MWLPNTCEVGSNTTDEPSQHGQDGHGSRGCGSTSATHPGESWSLTWWLHRLLVDQFGRHTRLPREGLLQRCHCLHRWILLHHIGTAIPNPWHGAALVLPALLVSQTTAIINTIIGDGGDGGGGGNCLPARLPSSLLSEPVLSLLLASDCIVSP